MSVLVSVIVPTHNRPDLVSCAVASALGQTVANIEVIVVDDGSDPAARLAADDPRVHLVRNDESAGVCAARNVGLRTATGRYVTFLDDDDELLPRMLETSLAAIDASRLPSPVAAISGVEVRSPGGGCIGVRMPVTLERGKHYMLEANQGKSFVTHSTLVAPTDVLRSIGGFEESIQTYEHDDLFLRLNQICSLQGAAEVTYRILDHGGERNSGDVLNTATARDYTFRKHREIFLQHRKRAAHYQATTGGYYLRSGRRLDAIKWSVAAVARGPSWHNLRVLAACVVGPKAVRALRSRMRG